MFAESEAQKGAVEPQQDKESEIASDDEEEPPEDVEIRDPEAEADVQARARAQAELAKRFNAARDAELPGLIAALKDPVWLTRQRAALALMNMRSPAAVRALAETAVSQKEDRRVREMAFLALAEIPGQETDAYLRKQAPDRKGEKPWELGTFLQQASREERWDVGVYAAHTLARRGDRFGVARIVSEMSSADKRARFAATWLAGQLGTRPRC